MRWLLLLPFLAVLWPPLYNIRDPVLLGFPFFYWYQILCIPGAMLLTWLVWRSERP